MYDTSTLSDTGRLSVSSEDLTNEQEMAKDIERDIKEAAQVKQPKSSKYTKIAEALKIVGETSANLKVEWDREKLATASKAYREEWDNAIFKARNEGASDEELVALTKEDGALVQRLQAKFDEETSGVLAYTDTAAQDLKDYRKLAQRKIVRDASMNILKKKRQKTAEILNKVRMAGLDDILDTATFQSQLRAEVKGIGLRKEDEATLWTAIRDAEKHAYFDKAIREYDEDEARRILPTIKSGMTYTEYYRAKSDLAAIPRKVDAAGLNIVKSGDIGMINAFASNYPSSTVAKVHNKVISSFLSEKDQFNKPIIPDLSAITSRIKADPKLDEYEKQRRLEAAKKTYDKITDLIKEDPSGIREIFDEDFRTLSPEQKKEVSGRYTNNTERRQLGEALRNAYLQGKLNTFLNQFGPDEIWQGKFKEAIQHQEDVINGKDKKGQYIIKLLKTKMYHGDAVNIDEKSVKAYLANTPVADIPSTGGLIKNIRRNQDIDTEAYDEMSFFFEQTPGGKAVRDSLVLDAWVKAVNSPTVSGEEGYKMRYSAFADALNDNIKAMKDNKDLIGDTGKWTAFTSEGSLRPVYLDNDLLTGPNASQKVAELREAIGNKQILSQPIFHPSVSNRIGDAEDSRLELRKEGNKLALWYSYKTDEGYTRWDIAVDLEGQKILTSEQQIGKYGALAFRNAYAKKTRLHPVKKGTLSVGSILNSATSVRTKRDADLKALIGFANTKNPEDGIDRIIYKGDKTAAKGKLSGIKAQESMLADRRRRTKEVLKERGLKDSRTELVVSYIRETKGKEILISDKKSIVDKILLKRNILEGFESVMKLKTIEGPGTHKFANNFIDKDISKDFLDVVEASAALGILPRERLALRPIDKLSMSEKEVENYRIKVNAAIRKGEEARRRLIDAGYDFSRSRMNVNELSSDKAIDIIKE